VSHAPEPDVRGQNRAATDRKLVLCSKSRWQPALRREHAIAEIAASTGCEVTFVEAPRDIRSVGVVGVRRWARGLGGLAARAGGVTVVERTTLAPAHRGALTSRVDARLLASILEPHDVPGATVVATTPWQWPTVAGLRRARRVFDCADDWATLIPRAEAEIAGLLDRVAGEADAIVAASERIADLFGGRRPAIVPNGTDARLLSTAPTPLPSSLVMRYAGTLSERLDVDLLRSVIGALPDWRVDLYGECSYAGCAGRPAGELSRLLADFPNRVMWHGVVSRDELASSLDGGRVLVLPHRRTGAIGGDSMKLYDYAARGRPIVSTRWADDLGIAGPPGLVLADSAADFAAAVARAGREAPGIARLRREWAESHRWTARWDAWARAVFGA
jgi:glycosyltransferase involved in cell wall biosynthesis